jgi:hypothetical protein
MAKSGHKMITETVKLKKDEVREAFRTQYNEEFGDFQLHTLTWEVNFTMNTS